jgi:hypothetical protein
MESVYRKIVSLIDSAKATPAQKLQAKNMAESFYVVNDYNSLARMLNRLVVGGAVPTCPNGIRSSLPALFNDNFNPRNQMPQVPARAYPLYSNFGVPNTDLGVSK